MSRRSVLVAVGILLFLGLGVSTGVVLLLGYEPGYYRQAAAPSGDEGDMSVQTEQVEDGHENKTPVGRQG